jgi:hypothetical protein
MVGIDPDASGDARCIRLAHGRVHGTEGFVVVATYAHPGSHLVAGGILTVGPRLGDVASTALSQLIEFTIEAAAWEDWVDVRRDQVDRRQRQRWRSGDEPGDEWHPISVNVSGAQVPGWSIESDGGWALAAELPQCLLGVFGLGVSIDDVHLAPVGQYAPAWPDSPEFESSAE